MKPLIERKAAFARRLGVTTGAISCMIRDGRLSRADGSLVVEGGTEKVDVMVACNLLGIDPETGLNWDELRHARTVGEQLRIKARGFEEAGYPPLPTMREVSV